METLSRRALNRATLSRQLLLRREAVVTAEAVARVGGLQAQEARPPFLGLWSRVEGFTREDLHRALHDRDVVRAPWARATLHLVAGDEYADLRATLDPVMADARRALRGRDAGLDVDAVVAAARRLLARRPRTFGELRAALLERFPEVNERALGYAVRTALPVVMVPTDDRWSFPPDAAFAPAERWLGRRLAAGPDPAGLARRYLAAWGPASAADMQTWSGLKGLVAVLKGMGEELVTFRDERGRTLFDLPDAPRPGEDVAAPARLLPEFDDLVLAHDDRTRVVADEHRPVVVTKNLRVRAVFLWDGFAAGTWTVDRARGAATLQLAPFGRLPRGARPALEEEAEALLRFAEPDARSVGVAVTS